MKNLFFKLSPLFCFLLLFSCAKENDFSPTKNETELIQAKHDGEKPCDIPCRKPDYLNVGDIDGCSAVLNFGFETKTCGTFVVQLQNLTTGAFTYFDPATSPFSLTDLEPCTKYTVGVSHVTDKCASIPLKVSFKTACKKCKDCNIKCKDPDFAYVSSTSSTSATINFGFDILTCGYFVAQLKNNDTGIYTYIDPATSPLVLTGLEPCTSYTIGLSHVTDLCAKIPTKLDFTTDCPGYCDVEGLDYSCLYNQYVTLTSDNHPGIWTQDGTVGYLDATQSAGGEVLFVAPGTSVSFSASGNCFCGTLGGIIYMKLWIDYDQDFDFEASELVYTHDINLGSPGSSSDINCLDISMPGFTFPNIAVCGLTARYIISTDPTAGPCGTFAVGQAVDFTINSASCL